MSITATSHKESPNFDANFEEETEDEFKIRLLLACITIDASSKEKPTPELKPTSEGVASLR